MSNRVEMRVHTTTIFNLMEALMAGQLVIPVFQRDYVWTKQQVDEFVDSLLNCYPLGVLTLIGSRGLPPIEIKEIFITKEGQDLAYKHVTDRGIDPDYEIVLDGAQRLQTIYKLLVTGEYQVLYNPLDESWKVCTAEELEGADSWPYISMTSAYNSYCLSSGLREYRPYWPDRAVILSMQANNPMAKPAKMVLMGARTRGHAVAVWQARFKERLLRLEQGRRQRLPEGVEGGDELLDQYVKGCWQEGCLPEIPDTLKGAEFSDKEKQARRSLIARTKKQRDKEHSAILERYKEVFDIIKSNQTMINVYLDRIDDFEAKLTRHSVPVNRFSVGKSGSLKEVVRIFKRLNTAGVPVDTNFLDELVRKTEGE